METRKRSNGNTVSNKGPKGSKGPKGPKKASVHKPKTDEEKKEKRNENARIRRYNRTEEEKKEAALKGRMKRANRTEEQIKLDIERSAQYYRKSRAEIEAREERNRDIQELKRLLKIKKNEDKKKANEDNN